MTVTLTAGTTTVTPHLLLGWETTRQSRNVIHEIIGAPEPYVTLVAAATESGTLQFLFDNVTDADAAMDLFASGQVITMAVDDLDTLTMDIVLSDRVSRTLDDQTLTRWIVAADIRQVTL
jgi:hypothetical protein